MRIALVAGEASGDLLGAGLLAALRRRVPELQACGIGGPALRAQGLELWWPSEELAVMGLIEVLGRLPKLLTIRRDLVRRLMSDPPDLYLGIDAPDFNLPVEARLKMRGVPTVHYVSPSIWAWRPERAARIGRCADQVLCLFPFEPELYARHGVRASFVGHPLADHYPLQRAPTAARATLGLPLGAPLLAVLPGSRRQEIRRLAPTFLAAAMRLRERIPRLVVAIPAANADCLAQLRALIEPRHGVLLYPGQADLILQAADAALIASGTASLEALLARVPMVVAYRLAPLTHAWVRWAKLMRSPWFALPNVLAQRRLVVELAQDEVRTDRLVEELTPLLTQPPDPDLLATYARIHAELRCDASQRAAEAILTRLSPAS
jgi:lipid-A-disaccharide synthase